MNNKKGRSHRRSEPRSVQRVRNITQYNAAHPHTNKITKGVSNNKKLKKKAPGAAQDLNEEVGPQSVLRPGPPTPGSWHDAKTSPPSAGSDPEPAAVRVWQAHAGRPARWRHHCPGLSGTRRRVSCDKSAEVASAGSPCGPDQCESDRVTCTVGMSHRPGPAARPIAADGLCAPWRC